MRTPPPDSTAGSTKAHLTITVAVSKVGTDAAQVATYMFSAQEEAPAK